MSNSPARVIGVLATMCLLLAGAFTTRAADDAPAAPPPRVARIVDDFIAACRAKGEIPEEQRNRAIAAATAARNDPDRWETAVTEGLREVHPDFRVALAALAEERYDEAIPALSALAVAGDPYLAVEASFYLARAHVVGESYEEALPLLTLLTDAGEGRTLHAGQALFLRGMAEARLLRRKEAIATLNRFIENFPDAPERTRIAAWRETIELEHAEDGSLADIRQRMDFTRRRLGLFDAGERTQQEQERIVAMITRLIKEAEDRESQGGGSGSGQGRGQGQSPGGGGTGEGMGEGGSGENDQTPFNDRVFRPHRGGPRSAWGELRENERQQVLNAIKAKYPGRYQQLIEQYYKSLQDEE
jgi:tetratricopeptide (TPR) repeat protein